MEMTNKLRILADAAKYDIHCAPRQRAQGRPNAVAAQLPAAYTVGRRAMRSCSSSLYTNVCQYDCAYCINRRSNVSPASLHPGDVVKLTMVLPAQLH